MGIQSYRDLVVWQRAMQLAEDTYKASMRFPRSEIYGLAAQLQRCAVSIPSNIAEGHARDSTKEFLRFLSIARGSAAELETQVLIAKRLGYLRDNDTDPLLDRVSEIIRMLRGLQAKLKTRIRSLTPNP